MRIEPELSPCRTARHGCSIEHADLVRGYREHRYLWELERELKTGGYATEIERYGPGPTFKEWLRFNHG